MVTRVRRSSPGPHLRRRPTRTLSETPRPHHGRGYGRCRRCGRTRRAHTCLRNRPEGGFAQAPTARQLLVDHTPEEPRGCTDATTCVQTSSLSRDRQQHDPLRLSKPVELAFTTGPPPVMAAPGERGRVQSRSCCAAAAGMRAAASRPGLVLVREGAGLRAAQCARRGPR